MTVADIFILGMGVLGGAAALLVVTSRNVVHAALYLVVALLSVAGAFLALGAEFLAWAQVLVYVGAVVVLILFGLMLTRAPIGPMAQHNENRRLAAGVSGALFLFLVVLIFDSFGGSVIDLQVTRTAALGEHLYIEWAFPFMVLGFFLTVSLIGAIIIARREEGEGPLPPGVSDDPDRLKEGTVEPAYSDATSSPGVASFEEEVSQR
jgi:NADH-quinone oxidoreductase subunit J